MKEKIHPEFFVDAKISCACGNTITVGSTHKLMKVETCSKCHPFFTGERRMMDTAGRVERFRRRYKMVEQAAAPAPAVTPTPEPIAVAEKPVKAKAPAKPRAKAKKAE